MATASGRERVSGSVEGRLAARTAEQFGVFSRGQALGSGASNGLIQRRLRSGRWERLHPGVYRIAGTPPTWRQALMAAILWLGAGAVVSHLAAAALWRLPGFPHGPIELLVPDRRAARRASGMRIRSIDHVPQVDRVQLGPLPVTTPGRTLVDVAGLVDLSVLEIAIDDALRRGLVSLPRLRWRLDELSRKGRAGVGRLREVLDARASGSAVPQSVFETKLRQRIRAAGLPEPVAQYAVRDRGRVVAVVDFAYVDERLAIEADGYRWHHARARFEHDRARAAALTRLGWRQIYVTWRQLSEDADRVVSVIADVLGVNRS